MRNFNPDRGVLARAEADETIDFWTLKYLFDWGAFEYFEEMLGGKERLKERISVFRTTGDDGPTCVSHFLENKIRVLQDPSEPRSKVGRMLESDEFEAASPNEKIFTICLSAGELLPNVPRTDSTTYGEVLKRAEELGLGFLPHEAAVDLLVENKLPKPINDEYFEPVTKPFKKVLYTDFGFQIQNSYFNFIGSRITDLEQFRHLSDNFIFCLQPGEEYKIKHLLE